MLATDATLETTEKRPLASALETWSENERMRHVPSIEWIIGKLDQGVRTTLGKLLVSFGTMAPDDSRRAAIDAQLKTICRAIDRLSDAARPTRANGAPAELTSRIHWAIDHAVANLKTVDATSHGRRYPVHTFDRSRGEPLYGALLVVLHAVERLLPLMREVDPGLDERLLEGLVVLENPVDERMLQPIAKPQS